GREFHRKSIGATWAHGPTRAPPRIPIPRGSHAGSGGAVRRQRGAALLPLSRYRATARLTGSTRRGGGIWTNHRGIISNRRLAQNEERKSEHDACREDGSDLRKRGCTVSRSKFRCLIPPARTKNVPCRSPSRDGQPGSQPKGRCRFAKEMGASRRG